MSLKETLCTVEFHHFDRIHKVPDQMFFLFSMKMFQHWFFLVSYSLLLMLCQCHISFELVLDDLGGTGTDNTFCGSHILCHQKITSLTLFRTSKFSLIFAQFSENDFIVSNDLILAIDKPPPDSSQIMHLSVISVFI